MERQPKTQVQKIRTWGTLRVIRGFEWEKVFQSDRIYIQEDDFSVGAPGGKRPVRPRVAHVRTSPRFPHFHVSNQEPLSRLGESYGELWPNGFNYI
jgi:hypothetical protein